MNTKYLNNQGNKKTITQDNILKVITQKKETSKRKKASKPKLKK